MKSFLSILFSWRNPKRLPIPTHAELVEKVAVLSERVARQNAQVGSLDWQVARLLSDSGRVDALDRLKAEPDVIQPLRPGEAIATAPTPFSERPWERETWLHPEGGWCWYHHGPSLVARHRWIKIKPGVDFSEPSDGWLLPHYSIPSIPEAWLREYPVPAPGAAEVAP